MGDKIIKPERRRPERRPGRLAALGEAVSESTWDERRIHCWNLEPDCTDARQKRCAAHFVRRNCWDLWATEYFPPGRKPCCHRELDCSVCRVAVAKFGPEISVHVAVPGRGKANLLKLGNGRVPSHCPSLFSVKEAGFPRGSEGAEPKVSFKCQRRPGIVLHGSYVSEVCGTVEHRECNFYGTA